MAKSNEIYDENIKKSLLASCQSLQFSKIDKPDSLIADLDRRCLFLKYTTCQKYVSDDAAGVLLENNLDNYSKIIDDRTGLNNYWKQFNLLNLSIENNPLDWKSNLTDPNIALDILKPISCDKDSTTDCKNKNFNERDFKKFLDLWASPELNTRSRKLPKNVPYKSSFETFSKSNNLLTSERPSGQSLFEANKNVSYTRKEFETEKISKFKTPQGLTKSVSFEKTSSNKCNLIFKKNESSVKNSSAITHKNPKYESNKETSKQQSKFSNFKTAREELSIQQAKNNYQQPTKKTLGGRPVVNSKFVSPFQKKEEECEPVEPVDERLKNIEPKMIELIRNEIMDCGNPVLWDDIAGLEHAKRIIKEIVVFPMLRPDIFTGLRRPPKGILLFGPPGTGKTLIGKCIASQSKSTFFSISASSLTSKWIGEGEKMVRALFAVARVEQPSVVFIDEIDSLLCQRSETEHESSRRMKTEFLVQLDGATTGDDDRILVVGATNRPYELDEAARRRLVKRLYIPLPELEARAQIIRNLLKSERNNLSEEDIMEISTLADGYSGADMTNLCKEASMGPIRSIPFSQLEVINTEQVRMVTIEDFKQALNDVRPSVSQKDLCVYLDWDRTYGSSSSVNRN